MPLVTNNCESSPQFSFYLPQNGQIQAKWGWTEEVQHSILNKFIKLSIL